MKTDLHMQILSPAKPRGFFCINDFAAEMFAAKIVLLVAVLRKRMGLSITKLHFPH